MRQRRHAPNDRLSQARLRRRSPTGSGRPMSRQDLADQANEFIFVELVASLFRLDQCGQEPVPGLNLLALKGRRFRLGT